jgi:restriction system protein
MDRDPESPWNPRQPTSITPSEFEDLVLGWLKATHSNDKTPFEAEHLGVIEGEGGTYKIDVLVRLTILGGASVVVLVECKHKGRPIEREAIMVLEAKLRDVGAHKGMLFSTSGFQAGALQYAAARGIATITVIEGKWLFETKDALKAERDPPPWADYELYAGIRVTATEQSVSCHTIEADRVDALTEWLAAVAPVD